MSLVVNSLWIGNKLGEVHAACLRSFVNKGHRVVLHSYGKPEDTPKGVEIFDARKLMKESEIVRTATGNLALASDIYRYRILKEGLGLYIDCDVYCVKPIKDDEYILGWETQYTVNGAILKVPHDSQILKELMLAAENPYFIPPWFRNKKALRYKLKKALGFPKPVSKQEWGTIGPLLITYLVKNLMLQENVSPIDFYYPMHHQNTTLLSERGLTVKDLITPRTVAFHLYSTAGMGNQIVKYSPLHEIINS